MNQTKDTMSRFSMSRRIFMSVAADNARTLNQDFMKQWLGSRDSSSVIAKRRSASIGKDSYNVMNADLNAATFNDGNTISSALRRARG